MSDGSDQANGDQTQAGVSRREALKRIGVAGAIWTTPVTMSFFTAQTTVSGPPGPNPECRGATCETFTPCSSTNTDCVCVSTPEGGFCIPGSTPCATLDACGAGNSCPAGSVCAIGTCCGEPVCIPLTLTAECPAEEARFGATSATRTSSGAGTIGG